MTIINSVHPGVAASVADHTGGDDCIVVIISASTPKRVAVAELVGSQAPVVLVSSQAEAARIFALTAEPDEPEPAPVPIPVATPLPAPRSASSLEVDSDGRVARVGERSVGLSPLEHDLITVLLQDPGHTWLYAELQERVWGHRHTVGRDDVSSVVKRLREKLRGVRSPVEIDAVRGIGLRLVDVTA